MPNYFNPTSVRPAYAPEPEGALASGWAMRDRRQYEELMGLQEQMQRMEMERQAAENQAYGLDAPVREAQRAPKISGAGIEDMLNRAKMGMPGFPESQARGAMGLAGSQEAAGRIALDTAGSTISSTNAKNQLEATQHAVRFLDFALPHLEQIQGTGIDASTAYAQFRAGIPPEIAKSLPPQWSPDLPQRLKALREQLVQTPAHQGAMALGKQREDAHGARSTAEIAGRERVAKIGAEATQAKSDLDMKKQRATIRKLLLEGKPLTQEQLEFEAAAIRQDMIKDPQYKEAAEQSAYDEGSPDAAVKARAAERMRGVQARVFDEYAIGIMKKYNPYKTTEPKKMSMKALKQMYPNRSESDLRKAYKEKYGVDPS